MYDLTVTVFRIIQVDGHSLSDGLVCMTKEMLSVWRTDLFNLVVGIVCVPSWRSSA